MGGSFIKTFENQILPHSRNFKKLYFQPLKEDFVGLSHMKTHPYFTLIAGSCAALLASCANQPVPNKMPVSASIHSDSSVTGRLFQEVNNYRASKGKASVQRHPGLDKLAQQHSEYLRAHRGSFSLSGKNVSHIGFEGRALYARERYQMDNVSENVAAATRPGQNSPHLLLQLWQGSKDHNENMLDDWTYSGIGVAVDEDGTVFATQLFGNASMSQMSMRTRFNQF